jgi:hypothetical protein
MKTISLFALLLVFCVPGFAQASKTLPKLSTAEIVAKHLASIGNDEAIAAAKSRIFVGTGRVKSKIGYVGQLDGPAQFASTGDSVLLAMMFSSNEYPYEKVAYNGKELSVGHPNGQSSNLGDFLRSNKIATKSGIFGGVLSSAWPFLRKDHRLKLEYAGTAESNGRGLYKVKVTGLGTTAVTLFFDGETFRHLATEYSYDIPVRITRATNPRPEADDFGTSTSTGQANAKPTYVTLT